MDVFSLIKQARENGCSDLHITAGTAVAVRKYGELFMLDQVPTLEESEEMILSLLKEDEAKFVLAGNDLDVAVPDEKGNRIRGNVYHQRNNLAASIRLIDSNIPTLSELNMPPVIQKLAELRGGLVLVTGPTGSGKSTTLASMLDHINKTQPKHIITIEDPIEYVYKYDKAMIHQRQIRKDVSDFASALRSSLREDPDIIMVGEMRDYETINAAITAAETGHLVLSTLHTQSAAQTIERIISSCPIEAEGILLSQLSSVLAGVITQTLVPLDRQEGRIAATEIMLNNTAVANLIKEKKYNQINSTIQANLSSGMHTLNYSLMELVKHMKITREEAIAHSNNVPELEKNFGIVRR
ncbi:twitching motility protein PilT [Lachnospiraceae bacterium RM5]|nr:twitching motility protein PilT [Lachnospiraceae bacterium RM5]